MPSANASGTMRTISERARRSILEPPPDCALARAREYGIDLTSLLEGLLSSPERRIERGLQAAALAMAFGRIRDNGSVD